MGRAGLLATLLMVAFGALTAAKADDRAVPHFALSKSTPEAGAVGPAPSEVRLWFTEEPAEGTTSIRVVDAGGEAVHTTDVAQDAEDPESFSVSLHGTLAPGDYTVAWRALGDDGHVVRGDFDFTVSAL